MKHLFPVITSEAKQSRWGRSILALCGISLGILAIFLSVSAIRLKAADNNPLAECKDMGLDLDERSGYADFNLSTEDVMVLYHETINTIVNEYIAKMVKGKKAAFQLNVRLTREELDLLQECQKKLGGLSQSDTIRMMLLLFLGKIPNLQKRFGRGKNA